MALSLQVCYILLYNANGVAWYRSVLQSVCCSILYYVYIYRCTRALELNITTNTDRPPDSLSQTVKCTRCPHILQPSQTGVISRVSLCLKTIALPHANFNLVLQKNRLPHRASFFSYRNDQDALTYDYESLSTAKSLNGTWKFNVVDNPLNAPDGFESSHFDSSQWADIAVPGMWQLQGFGQPQYTNTVFPFPVDPPNVPYQGNHTGSYIRKFSVPSEWKGSALRLRFEGVDSAFHVFCNGTQVGYSQGSRNPSEFDVTSLLRFDGTNTIAVRVYQFCDGSYIEDQVLHSLHSMDPY